MDSSSKFMDLLNSQQEPQIHESFSPSMGLGSSQVPPFGTQMSEDPEQLEEIAEGRRERRKWTPTEDIVLCSSWLNTSKDAVVGNEQKGSAFWKRIAAYFMTMSPNSWHKINDYVSKFVGCYESAKRLKTSGYNDSDVLKVAYELFLNDHKVKFGLEHAWLELRNDQKWCGSSTSKGEGSSKKRKLDVQSESSQTVTQPEDQPMARPEGVKAAKAKAKKSVSKSGTEESPLLEYQNMWTIKQKELAIKQRLSNNHLLESLIAKKEPLSELEVAVKNKLLADMLSNE